MIRFVLLHKTRVAVVYLILIVLGIFTALKLPIDVLPDLNKPRVTVFAEVEWLATPDIETVVTWPLERNFLNIPGVQNVRSSSAQWLSVINVEFDWWSDVSKNRQLLFERIQNIELPENTHTTLAPESALLGEVLWVGITAVSDQVSQADMRSFAETTLRQNLLTIPGISNLLIMGWSPKQFVIQLDPQKMVNYDLDLQTVLDAIEKVTNPAGAGVMVQKDREFPTILAPIESDLDTFMSMAIQSSSDHPSITLADIAHITIGSSSQRRWDALVDGRAGVVVRVSKIPNVNTVELTDAILAKMTELQKSVQKDYQIHTDLFQQKWFIEKWFANVEEALRDAAIIVGIMVFLFLMNARTTIITLVSLPITLLLTVLIFRVFGIGINIMILWGITIAIGELVDDAIVDMENIFRRLKENAFLPVNKRASVMSVIFHASSEVRWSVVYATILQLIVFIPFLLLPGIDGKLLAPIGIAYIISLLMSLVTAVTLVPVLCAWMLPNWIQKKADTNTLHEDTWVTTTIKKWVTHPIHWSLKNPKKALVLALCSLPVTFILYSLTEKEGLPPFNESSYTIAITTKPWSSLSHTLEVSRDFSEKIKTIVGITATSAIIGRADADAHAQWSNNSEVEVVLDRELSNAEKNLIFQEINKIITEFEKKAIFSIGQPITHRVEEIISWVRAPLVVKIFGDDLDMLEEYGNKILDFIKTVPGTQNVSLEPQTKIDAITFSPSLSAASQQGIPYTDIRNTIEVAIGGKEVWQVINGSLSYPVIATFADNWKQSLWSIGSIPMRNWREDTVPLSSLVNIANSKVRNVISHDNGQRRIIISGMTENRSIVDVVWDIQDYLETNPVPENMHIVFDGMYKAQQESSKLLLGVGILVFLGLIAVLYLHFHSMILVGQILLGILTAWLGGMIGIWISGGVITTPHIVGFIALMGIVARNGIMLLDHYKHLAYENDLNITKDLIIHGSMDRAIPVAMTALSAVFGLLPLVLWAGDTGKEILSPIATVIFWWLITSTCIEFYIRPGIFYRYSKNVFQTKIPQSTESIDISIK